MKQHPLDTDATIAVALYFGAASLNSQINQLLAKLVLPKSFLIPQGKCCECGESLGLLTKPPAASGLVMCYKCQSLNIFSALSGELREPTPTELVDAAGLSAVHETRRQLTDFAKFRDSLNLNAKLAGASREVGVPFDGVEKFAHEIACPFCSEKYGGALRVRGNPNHGVAMVCPKCNECSIFENETLRRPTIAEALDLDASPYVRQLKARNTAGKR